MDSVDNVLQVRATCLRCAQPITDSRKKKFCSDDCCRKYHSHGREIHRGIIHVKQCRQCKAVFSTKDRRQIYCSDRCFYAFNRGRRAEDLQITCGACGVSFTAKRRGTKFCSKRCRQKLSLRRGAAKMREKAAILGTTQRVLISERKGANSPGNRGAASELAVSLDLMNRGYHVFRSVGPNGPFDLVAFDGRHTIRVEVKRVLNVNHKPTLAQNGHDCIALHHPESGEIRYVPELSPHDPAGIEEAFTFQE